MLKQYVYKCLKEHGNTIISERTLVKFGEAVILRHLKEKGFDVTIEPGSDRYAENPRIKMPKHYILRTKEVQHGLIQRICPDKK